MLLIENKWIFIGCEESSMSPFSDIDTGKAFTVQVRVWNSTPYFCITSTEGEKWIVSQLELESMFIPLRLWRTQRLENLKYD